MTTRSLLLNNVLMSTSFAWAEGAVAAVLAVSAALVDKQTYAAAGVTLYTMFAVGTLVSPVVVNYLGLKRSLILGLFGLALFAAAFVFPISGVVVVVAGVSGFLGSVLWTAQGAYYTVNAVEYAKAGGAGQKSSIGIMSSIFAGMFPLALLICKLTSSVILQSSVPDPKLIIYTVYTAIAAAATCGMCFVAELAVPDSLSGRVLSENIKETLFALREPRLLLMIPTNAAFGFATSYFPVVVTPLLSDLHGAHMVGYLYAWAGAVSFVTAFGFTAISNRFEYGRGSVMCIGGICYVIVFAAMWAVQPVDLSAMVVLFAFYGAGNTVWQGTCMAVFSDYWHAHPLPAFANLKLHSGAASAVGFAVFPHVSHPVPEVVALFTAVVGVLCYLCTVPLGDLHPQQPVDVQMVSLDLIRTSSVVAAEEVE